MRKNTKELALIGLSFLAFVALQAFPKLAWTAESGYDGGFYLLSDDKNFKFKFNFQIQPRYEYTSKTAALDTSTFKMARLRTVFSGFAYSPKFTYLLGVEYSGAGDKPDVRAGFVDFAFADAFKLQLGQIGYQVNREDMFSATGLQLISGSIVSDHFGSGLDVGLQAYGDIIPQLTYYFFVLNGNGPNTTNKNRSFFLGSRLEYSVMGNAASFQGDLNYSDNPNLSFALAGGYDYGNSDETEDFDGFTAQGISPHDSKLIRGGGDAGFSWKGFSLITEEQFVYNPLFKRFDYGYMAQSGYFIIPKKFEVAGRYGAVVPGFPIPALAKTGITAGAGANAVPIYELLGGVNYYFQGHRMKLQTDYTYLMNRDGFSHINDQIIRAQLTMIF